MCDVLVGEPGEEVEMGRYALAVCGSRRVTTGGIGKGNVGIIREIVENTKTNGTRQLFA